MTFREQLEKELPHKRVLRRLAHNIMQSDSDVEDVLQMVHLRAWTFATAATVDVPEVEVLPLLRKFTRNEALRALQERKHEQSARDRYTRGENGEIVLNPDLVQVVLPLLTERQQEVVLAVADTGSFAKAAVRLGVSVDAVREVGEEAVSRLRSDE